MDIKEALESLDLDNDDLWTDSGLPKVEAVSDAMEKTVTRQEITDAAPQFTRSNPVTELEDEDAVQEEGEEEVDEDDEVSTDEPTTATDLEDIDLEAEDRRAYLLDLEPVHPLKFFKSLSNMSKEDAEALGQEASTKATELLHLRAEIDKMIQEHQTNMSNAKEHARVLTPRNQNQIDIMNHIRKQNEMRAEKAGAAARVREALGGVKLADVDPRSPLDKAMNQKPKRGTKRPSRI